MKRKWLYTWVMLLAGAISLHAQEHREKHDTVSVKPRPFPVMVAPININPWQPHFRSPATDVPESKEQRAARINQETFQRVMASVHHNLSWFQPPVHQFLSGPYSFQPGTVPVMSASNPFIFARTPGGAPVVHPYSPKAFPQCIRTEFDFQSGTYKHVMVKWDVFESRLEPVPACSSIPPTDSPRKTNGTSFFSHYRLSI